MELVQGVPLMDYVRGHDRDDRRTLSDIKERLGLFLKICDAISYAHQRGVIHRDLKPSNILVAEGSESHSSSGSLMGGPEIKILDFGLARITDPEAAVTTMVSEVGQIKGTLPYMSPEQVRGNPNEIDVRSDVYSLGVILYELLTDQLPYEVHRTSLPEAIRVICEEPPKPPGRVVSKTHSHAAAKALKIDRDVETIVLKALEKDPEQRYQSAVVLAEDVERYLTNQPILARPPSAMYQFRKLVARHKAPFAFVVAFFVLLLGFALTMWRQSVRIASERDKAIAAERLAAEQRDAAERALARAEEAEKRAITEAAHASAEADRAKAAQVVAEQRTGEAIAATEETNRQRTVAQRQSYMANLNAADSSLQVNEVAEARRRLAACEPSQRNWEWHHLYVRSDSSLATLRGHEGRITSVAFSPDGARIVSGAIDKTVRVWDAISGKAIATLGGHEDRITSVAFSPDGRRIASGSWDQTVRVWDAVSGKAIATVITTAVPLSESAATPDVSNKDSDTSPTSSDVSVTSDSIRVGKVTSVDLGVAPAISTHVREAGPVTSVAFSPDSQRIVSGSWDHTVGVWDAVSGKAIANLFGHGDRVTSVAFSLDGKQIASGSADKTVRVWDAASGKTLVTLDHEAVVTSLAFSPDGMRIASVSADNFVRVWDIAVGRALWRLEHDGIVTSVAFSPDGRWIAAGSAAKTVRVWDMQFSAPIVILQGHDEGVTSVAFSPDGERIASGSWDKTVRVWDVASGRAMDTLRGHDERVTSVAASPDGRRIASGSADTTVRVWDTASGKNMFTFSHTAPVTSIAFSPDGRWIASAIGARRPTEAPKGSPRDQTVRVWDAVSGKIILTLDHDDSVSAVVFSPDGKRIVIGSADKLIRVWDGASGKAMATLQGHDGPITSVAVSPDGRRIASGSDDKSVRVWDAASGALIADLIGHEASVIPVAFSPDGTRIASGSVDKTVRMWDVASGRAMATLRGHDAAITSVAFSPDGTRIISGSDDKTVRVWDAISFEPLLTLRAHEAPVTSLAFSPDGTRVISGSSDKTVRVWKSKSAYDPASFR